VSDTVSKIKEAADIVELISEHLPLKRSGANYVGLCPFHKDTKPSMQVSRTKGIFKCFSCGVGGDIFKFWSEYHKKDFKQSVKDLAEKYGIALTYSEEKDDQEFNKKIRMHELAAKFYTVKLFADRDAEHCRNYLAERNIGTATINEFRLGYAPADKNDWAKLITHLKENLEVTEDEIVEAGLAAKSEKSGKYYDRFRGRLMIPIMDERARTIAFGARALKDPESGKEPDPKYLNSQETQIYHKGDHLYAMNLAKDAIRKLDGVIVVEGYFDAIAAHQAGIKNVVANQGTALTAKQAKLLTKYSESKRIYLCFDSDKAGEQATERAIEVIMGLTRNLGAELRIIRVPSGKDPDELIRFAGADVFKETVAKAPLLMDYQIEKITAEAMRNPNPQTKALAVKGLAKYFSYLNSKIELAEYIKISSAKLKVNENIMFVEIQKGLDALERGLQENPYEQEIPVSIKNRTDKRTRNINGHMIYVPDSLYATEQEILALMLEDKSVLEDFLADDNALITEAHQAFLTALTDISFENPDLKDVNAKYRLLQNYFDAYPEYSSQLADIAVELDKQESKAGDLMLRYRDLLRKLQKHNISSQMERIISEIKDLEASDNADLSQKWIELQKQKQELVGKLQKIRLRMNKLAVAEEFGAYGFDLM
jgi:DNA primase